ncbi:MAG: short-chain dehydrogenase/reductase, partial [Rhodospirillales bacterium]|nr:short-chain dehydrogenase/reductase [Rhodospirillales bacterium]
MLSLKNKKVLIVGGSSGIGLGTAQMTAEAGANVTIVGRDQTRLNEALKTLPKGVVAKILDATSDAQVDAFFKTDPIWDHVVTSAGAGGRGVLADIAMDKALAAMDGKFWAYYRIARAVKLAPDGSLTFVSGLLSQKAAPGAALVSAVNAAVEGLTGGLALDFAPARVNTICPGAVDTPLWDQLAPAARKALYERVAKTLPTRMMGKPEHIAHSIMMVMTNPYITGTVMFIEGGS